MEIKIKVALTKRQIQVYELYKSGLTQQQIADKLGVSQPTISDTLRAVGKVAPWKVKILNKLHKFYEYDI